MIISVAAMFLSLSKKEVLELNWLANNFWIPIIFIPLTAGFLKFWTNSKSFVSSVMLAITFTYISGNIVGNFATISLMCGMIGSAIGLFGMHYWQKAQGIDPAKKHIFSYGSEYNFNDLLYKATSEGSNPIYYLTYAKRLLK